MPRGRRKRRPSPSSWSSIKITRKDRRIFKGNTVQKGNEIGMFNGEQAKDLEDPGKWMVQLNIPRPVINKTIKILHELDAMEQSESQTKTDIDQNDAEFIRPNLSKQIATDDISVPSGSSSGNEDVNKIRVPVYKYEHEDIITNSFDYKLNQDLANGIIIQKQNVPLSQKLCLEFLNKQHSSKYKSFLGFRRNLPIYKKRDDILGMLSSNQVIIISGETGCGKSTQVPQIILDDALINIRGANTRILVTQPLRIAASSLAHRVADERDESVGTSVGYAVRLDKVDARPQGSITYCTTGVLLADLELKQGLTEYSHIILDEVHEREDAVDLTMAMLKLILNKRKDLKVILMSATLNAEALSGYFENCQTVRVGTMTYPVTYYYLEDVLSTLNYKFSFPVIKDKSPKGRAELQKQQEYQVEIGPWLMSKKSTLKPEVFNMLKDMRIEDINFDLILKLLVHITKTLNPGAILVFLPGTADITKLINLMQDSECFPYGPFQIYPFHSKMPSIQQRQIFQRPPDGVRKIIIATNIAETSITIDDVVYVIDCGKIKMTGLNVEDNVSTLSDQWISRANLIQRRGRAGRCRPGFCWHLLTSYRASTIPELMPPQLQRSNLLEAVLSVKKLRLGLAKEALSLVPDPPHDKTIEAAVDTLFKCGALDKEERLTPLGWHMARLPVHPMAAKLLIYGSLFGCLERSLAVAAVWGFKDPFFIPIGKEKMLDKVKKDFALGEPSDHVALSEAIINWSIMFDKHSFAYEHLLSNKNCELLCDMMKQYERNLRQMGFVNSNCEQPRWEDRNENNFSVFKAVVAAALYPNIGKVKWRVQQKRQRIVVHTPEDGNVTLHPGSVMAPKINCGRNILCKRPGANWLVYWLKQKSTDLFLYDVTLIHSIPLILFSHNFSIKDVPNRSGECCIEVASFKIYCSQDTAILLQKLRALLDNLLAKKIGTKVCKTYDKYDNIVLKAVITIITAEDEQTIAFDNGSDSEQSDSGASAASY